jgi:RHS repeat-associated protein
MSASLHSHTPVLTVFDPRGLSVRNVAYYRLHAKGDITERIHRQVFNAQGRSSQQWDPRLFGLAQAKDDVKPNQATCYSLSGQSLRTESVDAGWCMTCMNSAGLSHDYWDSRGSHQRYEYDGAMRHVAVFEQASDDAFERCTERFTYAQASQENARDNRCGRLIRHDDPAGSLWHERFGLSGQPLVDERRFCSMLDAPNWSPYEDDRNALLEDKTYAIQWRHDAFGTVVEQTDAVGHVQSFELDIAGFAKASSLDGMALSKSILYDACGRAEVEQAGNDMVTTTHYSPVDGLLYSVKTCTSKGRVLQDLLYQYDPVGNITRIEDLSRPVQWFAQQRIQAISTFAYDSLYQLIRATGRESASQTMGPGLPRLELFGVSDDSRWRNYTQTYGYDSGGNLTLLKHDAGPGNSYLREMHVDERSNRSVFKDGAPIDFAKVFDARGNQQVLSSGQDMQWNVRCQLYQVAQVLRDKSEARDDDTESYIYDSSGQRIRKVRRAKTRGGEHVSEVRYLPGLEIRTRTTGEELHVVIALGRCSSVRLLHWECDLPVDVENDQLRYHLSDHLRSVTLELSQNAELISQEGYYPYGGTAWWAARSIIEAKYKSVRYSNKERDASGLYYYGFRYYAPWLQRWISPDPAGDVDGLNMYRFVGNSPMCLIDIDGRTFEESIIATNFSGADASGRFRFKTLGSLNSSLAAEVAFSDELNLTEVHPMDMSDYVSRFEGLSYQEQVAVRGWSSIGDTFVYHDRVDDDGLPEAINYEINENLAAQSPLNDYLMTAYTDLQSSISKLTMDRAVLLRTVEYSFDEKIPWGTMIHRGDIVTNGTLLMAVSESNKYAAKLTKAPEKETTSTLIHFLIKGAEAAPLVYGIASPVREEYERLMGPHAFFEVDDIAFAEKINDQGETDYGFMKRVGVVLKQRFGYSGPSKNIHTGL